MKMNRLILFAGLVLVLGMSACCSKKGSCDQISFNRFEVINFPDSALKGKVNLVIYDPKSGFTTPLNTISVTPVATTDPKVYEFTTEELDATYNYGVYFDTTGKEYHIGDFTASKVSCGKCFLKTNNRFGYELAAYRVNNRGQKYNGVIRVLNN